MSTDSTNKPLFWALRSCESIFSSYTQGHLELRLEPQLVSSQHIFQEFFFLTKHLCCGGNLYKKKNVQESLLRSSGLESCEDVMGVLLSWCVPSIPQDLGRKEGSF